MRDTYSFNDILRSNFHECSELFTKLFINTENNQILGYLCAKCPSDTKNGGHLKFVSQHRNYIHTIYGKNFIKNARILKIVKE